MKNHKEKRTLPLLGLIKHMGHQIKYPKPPEIYEHLEKSFITKIQKIIGKFLNIVPE